VRWFEARVIFLSEKFMLENALEKRGVERASVM